jgi:DNA-binding NarL/FixJ family response regulator
MNGVELLIREAAGRVLPLLGEDELRRRLGRRNTPALLRPPRAWCLAVRAGDTRINAYNAAMVPEDAMDPHDREHPGRVLPHTVVLDKRLLAKLCRHVEVEYGTTIKELAGLVGVRRRRLHYARYRNVVHTHYIASHRGHRFGNVRPVFYGEDALDPCARLFAGPDPVWSWTGRDLVSRAPEGFEQTVTRVPVYRLRTRHFEEHGHPEHPVNDPVPVKGKSVRLPRPPPDYVWYKWKGDVYVGYDWRSPRAEAGHMRRQRELEVRRAGRRRRYGNRRRSTGSGSLRFWGWAWICPGCKKPTKNLYLPVAPINLVGERLLRSVIKGGGDMGVRAGEFYPRTFACTRCHRVLNLSRAQPGSWNQLVGYLSGGLLYGREVPRPAGFHVRRRAYRPQSRRASPRREQVLRRVLNGWTIGRIARDLEIRPDAVWKHLRVICRQENVRDRHELAKKLGSPHAQPLTHVESVGRRRERVLALLLQGQTYRGIAKTLGLDYSTVRSDVGVIYRAHGGGGRPYESRQRLAAKFGRVIPPSGGDRRREEIDRRRAAGQSWRAIAREMGLSLGTVWGYGLRRRGRRVRVGV